MEIQEMTSNFIEKKYKHLVHIKINFYNHPVSGERIFHGEETLFRTNGMIKERCNWTHGKKDGLSIMNYGHTGDYNKIYLLRVFKSNETNGAQVYFLKH